MIRFIGIDLAWGERNLSGLAVLEWDAIERGLRLTKSDLLHSDEDIRSAITCISGKDSCLLAIDAPIIAPNKSGTARTCDREVSRDFRRYHAGAYPANREKCARPIRLRKLLEKEGYNPDPVLSSQSPCRHQLEIFPHPAQVVLFKRERIIKYKKGSVADKRSGLAELVENIQRYLCRGDPLLIDTPVLRTLLDTNVGSLSGRAMKGFEDCVDALLCAYMAAFYWQWGDTRCRIYGDLKTGYIICPRI